LLERNLQKLTSTAEPEPRSDCRDEGSSAFWGRILDAVIAEFRAIKSTIIPGEIRQIPGIVWTFRH